MKILIDTHFLLWIIFDDKKLTLKEKKIIQNPLNDIIISSISLLEINIKFSLKKLDLNGILPDEIPALLKQNGYQIKNINYDIVSSFYKLPRVIHKDPFDRLLVWESINQNYYFMTRDKNIKSYKKYGLLLLK
jgi:PIN domain nuclease of toxin-antitoxin system